MTAGTTLELVTVVVLLLLLLLIGAVHYDRIVIGKAFPMAPKNYGSGKSTRLAEPFPFTLTVETDDDEQTVHHFTATHQISKTALALAQGGEDVDLRQWMRILARTLDNSDGKVKAQWEGTPLPKPDDAGRDWEPVFRSPDGELLPLGELKRFDDQGLWTTRRRFLGLVFDPGNQIVGDVDTLRELTKDLVAATAGRPTDES